MRKYLSLFAVTTMIVLALTGCSNSSGGANQQTITLYSEANLDGYVSKEEHLIPPNFMADALANTMSCGDTKLISGGGEYHCPERAYVSFNISSIPTGAIIQSAILRLYKCDQGVNAATTYSTLGNLLIDHMSYSSFIEDHASGTLFQLAPLETLGTPFSTALLPLNQWKEMSVTAQIQNDLSGSRQHSQFRLRFEHDKGGIIGDWYETWSTGDSGTNKPELVITYTR